MAFLQDIENKVAIITGGSVGIGREICVSLARHGVTVIAVGRSEERLEQTFAEINQVPLAPEPLCLRLDVRSEGDMESMVEQTLDTYGRIDILISAAGILRSGEGSLKLLRQMTIEEWDDVIDTNLKGVFLANRAVLPVMIKQGHGDILNLSSTSGKKGLAFDTAYCASKFGVIGLTEALAVEMENYGVRVQSLLPGAIDTGMWNQNGPLPQPGAILPAYQVAEMVIRMLMMPSDVIIESPVIEPIKKGQLSGWISNHRAS